MIIGGLQRFSMIDYPGKHSAIIFTVGCNFRCGYCHNSELVLANRSATSYLKEEEIFKFLETRKGKLDGVVITGGEPTLHPDLPDFIRSIKDMGFLVKLDSQGSRPMMLKRLFDEGLIDYLAMDIKGPPYKYEDIVGVEIDVSKIKKSISVIMKSGIPYEFRTTVVSSQLNMDDFDEIGKMIRGSELYVIQKFVPSSKVLNPSFAKEKPYSDETMQIIREKMKEYVQNCTIR